MVSEINIKRAADGSVTMKLSSAYFDVLAGLVETLWRSYDDKLNPSKEEDLIDGLYLTTCLIKDGLSEASDVDSEAEDDDDAET